jgi:hypothetical protein
VTTRQVAILGAIAGLVVSLTVMIFLSFGVLGALRFGGTNLAYVLWPSSVLLTITWDRTIPGILRTAFLVALNCLMYVAIGLIVRACIRVVSNQR